MPARRDSWADPLIEPIGHNTPSQHSDSRINPTVNDISAQPTSLRRLRLFNGTLTNNMEIYQLKISLMDVRPLIWRRILVQDTVNLPQLHKILQIVMGWKNAHLHRFTVDRRRHLGRFEAFDNQPHPPSKVTLRVLLGEQDTKFLYYEYDFGDGWIHEICNEKAVPPEPGKLYPVCIGGERNCPPEDCGGSHGYQEMLKALRDERDPDHASTVEWIGKDFDPEAFDVDAVDRRVKRLKIR